MKVTLTLAPAPNDPAGLEGVVGMVRSAADAGFTRAWIPQLPPSAGVPAWDALTVLALAGSRVPAITLGTGVVVAYPQHPLALARQALTVSAATGGRVTVGIGVSHRNVVSDMFGYSYDAPAAYLREYLQVLGPALAGEPVDHHGSRIQAVGQVDLPGAPRPSLVAAALGPRMLDLAGELTDGVITAFAGRKAVEQQIVPRLTKSADAAGRPAPQVIVGLPVSVTSDPAAVREQLAAAFSPGEAPAYEAMRDFEGVDSIADLCVVGDEAEVLAQLRRFADLGATEFAAFPFGDAATQSATLQVLAANREFG